MATHKWDEYGNFRPGVKFFESLAAWLYQFDSDVDRATALDFVLERLVFLSDAEMTHLIELIYPDHMESVLLLLARLAATQDQMRRDLQAEAERLLRRGCPEARRTLNGGPPASSAPAGSVLGA